MSLILHNIYGWYRNLMDNQSDPRVNDWPMMDSPFPTICICLFYAYFNKILMPKFMANRRPYDLRNILIAYNLFQTVFSAWIFYEYLASGWWGHYSFKCQPVDYSSSSLGLRMARTCWWYYIAKFTEFFDTFFFNLRKKTEHVSTLHVIHHGCMPFSVWLGLKFAPGGHSTFFAMLNSFVHIVMYFYYMIAAMGPQYQKYIWWKKYLTTFQMVQFVAIFIHQFQLLFVDCNYPKGFMIWIGLHGAMFLFLFSDFYKTKYTPKQKASLADVSIKCTEFIKKIFKKPKKKSICLFRIRVYSFHFSFIFAKHQTSHQKYQTKNNQNGHSKPNNGVSNGNGFDSFATKNGRNHLRNRQTTIN